MKCTTSHSLWSPTNRPAEDSQKGALAVRGWTYSTCLALFSIVWHCLALFSIETLYSGQRSRLQVFFCRMKLYCLTVKLVEKNLVDFYWRTGDWFDPVHWSGPSQIDEMLLSIYNDSSFCCIIGWDVFSIFQYSIIYIIYSYCHYSVIPVSVMIFLGLDWSQSLGKTEVMEVRSDKRGALRSECPEISGHKKFQDGLWWHLIEIGWSDKLCTRNLALISV